mmetsp:Transcript_105274/g.293066  ORF Transcript_105274/g.293066 Transcript_105274/m.293066 type:complete len:679 (+) Transcript_105274:113-2149(+)
MRRIWSLGALRRCQPVVKATSGILRHVTHTERHHHLVVLVLENVAMPHEEAREVEGHPDPRHLKRVCDDGVLPARLAGWRHDLRAAQRPSSLIEGLAVHHEELHQVQVDGVRIRRLVPDPPLLCSKVSRVCDDPVRPHRDLAAVRVPDAQDRGLRGEGLGIGQVALDDALVVVHGDGVRVVRDALTVLVHADLLRRLLHQREVSRVTDHCVRVASRIPQLREAEDEVLRLRELVAGLLQHVELHDLPRGTRIRRLCREAAEGLVWARVHHPDDGARFQTAEVHDDIRALRGPQEQGLVGVLRRRLLVRLRAITRQDRLVAERDLDHLRQQGLVPTDHVQWHLRAPLRVPATAGNRHQEQVQEAGVAPVQQTEAVEPFLHLMHRPRHAIHHHDVEERLRVPNRRDVGVSHAADVRHVQSLRGGKELPVVRVEKRAVRVEGAVLDNDRDLPELLPGGGQVRLQQPLPLHRRGPRQLALKQTGLLRLALGVADEPEAGGTRVNVLARHAEGVVVEPEGRRGLLVVVVEARRPRQVRLAREAVHEGPLDGEALRDVAREWQVPSLGVPVALGRRVRPVHVDDHGHRAVVGLLDHRRVLQRRRIRVTIGAPLAVLARELSRVRPMQRLVHRKEVRQELAAVAVLVQDALALRRALAARAAQEALEDAGAHLLLVDPALQRVPD